MSMGNDRILSADELGEVVSTLARVAKRQQYDFDELLPKLDTSLIAFERGTTELTRDMPDKIAKQVVERIADQVSRSVTDVLRPAEEKAEALLNEVKDAVTTYRSAARDAVETYRSTARHCIIFACVSGLVTAVLIVFLAMKLFGSV